MTDYDPTKAIFDEMTAPVVAELVQRATAAKETPLLPHVADLNREQIAASRGVIVGVSWMALAGVTVWVLLIVARLIGLI